MNLIEEVLNLNEIQNDPPVLVDIGASGLIHKAWKHLAKHSICIAFDADTRELEFVEKDTSSYKKLYVINRIVSDKEIEEADFYLTESPYCSSLLVPDTESLSDWSDSEKFKVVDKTRLKTTTIYKILNQLNITKIDWYKSDSQGTDLRIYRSIDKVLRDKMIVAEFEPGFIDAYIGEDKLIKLISFMEDENFWISGMTVKGMQRITADQLNSISGKKWMKNLIKYSLPTSPGWAEITYLNDFSNSFTLRELLLGWVFATELEQHGFASLIAEKGIEQSDYKIFNRMKSYSDKKMLRNVFRLKFISAAIEKIQKSLKLKV